jgi:hypothetical protein
MMCRLLTLVCATLLASSTFAQDVRARLEVDPAHAEIGQPVAWTLVVEHPSDADIALPKLDDLPRAWILLDTLGVRRESDPAAPGSRSITRATWRVAALEGGELALPALKVEWTRRGNPGGEPGRDKGSIEALPPKISIAHALSEGEDAPRPSKGFRPTPAFAQQRSKTAWIALYLVVVSGLGFLAWRQRRRKPATSVAPAPLQLLAAIEARAKAEPERSRETVYDLTALLRAAVDAFLSEKARALTDAAWIARIAPDERVPAGVRSASARILGNAESAKYARIAPSRFALDEMLADVRSALEALALAPRPAPAPAPANANVSGPTAKEAA